MAAARHVLIVCGSTEIDGYAFCLGLNSLGVVLKESVCRVTPLIRESIFRSKQLAKTQERFTLAIQPLAELVDVYHAQEATKCHDKIYALLGMSPDDFMSLGYCLIMEFHGENFCSDWLSTSLVRRHL